MPEPIHKDGLLQHLGTMLERLRDGIGTEEGLVSECNMAKPSHIWLFQHRLQVLPLELLHRTDVLHAVPLPHKHAASVIFR